MTNFIKGFLINDKLPSFKWKLKPLSSTRWNRNYNKVSEYYFKWEIDVMRKPEYIHDIKLMNTIIPVPTLHFMEKIEN